MRHDHLLARYRALLLLIDFQESYRRVLLDWDAILGRASGVLLRGCRLLGVPVLVTSSIRRVSETAAEIATHLTPAARVLEKHSLSFLGSSAFVEALAATDARNRDRGSRPCVRQPDGPRSPRRRVSRCTWPAMHRVASSRRPRACLDQDARAGMLATTVEQALLELVQTSEAPGSTAASAPEGVTGTRTLKLVLDLFPYVTSALSTRSEKPHSDQSSPRLENDGCASVPYGERDQDPSRHFCIWETPSATPKRQTGPLCQVVAKVSELNKRMLKSKRR